jgi:hypothetical protein
MRRLPNTCKRRSSARRVSVSQSQGKKTASLEHTGVGNRAILKRSGIVNVKQSISYDGDRLADVNEHSDERVIASRTYQLYVYVSGFGPGIANRLARMAKHNGVELKNPVVSSNGTCTAKVVGEPESLKADNAPRATGTSGNCARINGNGFTRSGWTSRQANQSWEQEWFTGAPNG